MSEKRERPVLRIVVILSAVSVLGLFLGWFMERMFYGDVPDEEEAVIPQQDTFAAPERQSGPSAWETEVIRRATAGLPQYPNAEAHALAMDYMGPNVPIAAAWFTTEDTPDEVLGFYAGQFQDAGIPMTGDRASENGGYVAYMNPLTENVRSVTATRQGDQTVVLLSNGNMRPLLEGKQNLPPNVPLPDDAQNTMVMALNPEGASDVTVSATVAGTDVGKMSSFYEQALAMKGWKVERTEQLAEGAVQLHAVQSGLRSTTYLRRDDDGANIDILVRLNQTH